jgi:CubicO group peptidase (beta-lactamase class C family)
MRTRRLALFLGAWILSGAAVLAEVPSDAEIRKILVERVGSEHSGIAIAVGVIDANGRRVVTYGSLAKDDKRRLDGDTVFEIGSMTKVFTSLLLMDMVDRGEVNMDDPASKYLPASVKMPERNGRKITLADLSTQSSGLPRIPSNFGPKDNDNPYTDYSVQQLYDLLSGYQLTRDPGSQYEYSNLGVGLLGHVLTLRAGMSYESLVRSRICDPLGMADTRITLTPAMKDRLAIGHNVTGAAVGNWDIPTLAGAGALRSTVNDILKFLAANLGYVKSPLAKAMAEEVSIRRPTGMPDMEIAYAWHVQSKDGSAIIWHNGGTGGYRTFMGFDPKARTGAVVLTNISTAEGGDDLGRHLLNAAYPLSKVTPPAEHQEITLDPKIIDRYVGTYQLGPLALLAVWREGSHVYSQLTGQPKVEIYAESERKFFLKVVDAQLTFDEGATQVTLHQNGRDSAAKRLGEADVERVKEQIAAHDADVARRIKENKPAPGTEAALRRSIAEMQKGEPDYSMMGAGLADLTRKQFPLLKKMLDERGALQSVTFKSVMPGGLDVYEVKFERGSMRFMITLGPDGKTQGLGLSPM